MRILVGGVGLVRKVHSRIDGRGAGVREVHHFALQVPGHAIREDDVIMLHDLLQLIRLFRQAVHPPCRALPPVLVHSGPCMHSYP